MFTKNYKIKNNKNMSFSTGACLKTNSKKTCWTPGWSLGSIHNNNDMNINMHIDMNMNIDIRIIINMNIEDHIDYYTVLMANFQATN